MDPLKELEHTLGRKWDAPACKRRRTAGIQPRARASANLYRSTAAAGVAESDFAEASALGSASRNLDAAPADVVRSAKNMAPAKDNAPKRKATDEPGTPVESKRAKTSQSQSVEPEDTKISKAAHTIPFPEKVVVRRRDWQIIC